MYRMRSGRFPPVRAHLPGRALRHRHLRMAGAGGAGCSAAGDRFTHNAETKYHFEQFGPGYVRVATS